MASILHLGKSGLSDKSINDDDIDRVALCLNVLSDSSELMVEVFNKLCRESLDKMLSVKASEDKQKVNHDVAFRLIICYSLGAVITLYNSFHWSSTKFCVY